MYVPRNAWRGVAILFTITVVGLFIVKWQPYYARALTAAATHLIGRSILTAGEAAPPPASLQAAWDYGVAYFQSIWQAMVLGLLLAATIETLVPHNLVARLLGSVAFRSTALAGLMSLPCMMCTCCTAPVAIGLRRSGASVGASVAYFLGNPTLNPAVLVFLLFTLGPPWAIMRLLLGLVIVFGGATIAARLDPTNVRPVPLEMASPEPASTQPLALRWLRALAALTVRLLPEYIVLVGLLGLARVWLFPAAGPDLGNNLAVMIPLAIAATLFVIPTAGEIPIIQTMLGFGVGAGPAGVLLLTLAPLSLPSLVMMSRVLPWRIVVVLALSVMAVGLIAGALAIGAGFV